MLVRLSFSTLVFSVIFSQTLSGHGNPLDDATLIFISDSGSLNIELPESEIKVGVASSRGLPCPLKCHYLLRATIFQGRLISKELRYAPFCRDSTSVQSQGQ